MPEEKKPPSKSPPVSSAGGPRSRTHCFLELSRSLPNPPSGPLTILPLDTITFLSCGYDYSTDIAEKRPLFFAVIEDQSCVRVSSFLLRRRLINLLSAPSTFDCLIASNFHPWHLVSHAVDTRTTQVASPEVSVVKASSTVILAFATSQASKMSELPIWKGFSLQLDDGFIVCAAAMYAKETDRRAMLTSPTFELIIFETNLQARYEYTSRFERMSWYTSVGSFSMVESF